MSATAWVTLLLTSVAGGAGVCFALVAPRRRSFLGTMASAVCWLAAIVSLVAIARTSNRFDTTAAAGFIAIAASLGGFALASTLVPAFTRLPPPMVPASLGDDDGSVRFVLLADAEPEAYDPALVTLAFDDLEDTDVGLPPDAARTFAYVAEKARYRSAGLSPARLTVMGMAERIQAAIDDRGVAGSVLVAYSGMPPRLADVASVEAQVGARRFIVMPVDVAETRRTDLALRELAALGLAASGVTVTCTPPLWGRIEVARAVAERILAELTDGPNDTDAAVLVMRGQPTQWQRDFPAWGEQETYFAQRVRALLADGGLAADHVRVAHLDWQSPDVAEAARHLAAVGCTRIAICPAVMPFDTLETLVDLSLAAEQAAEESEASVVVLPAWGADDTVVQAMVEELLAVLGDEGQAPAIGARED